MFSLYTLRKSNGVGNSICPKFLAYSTLILTFLAILVQAYEKNGTPSEFKTISADNEYDSQREISSNYDSDEGDNEETTDIPSAQKRFFRNEGVRYPLIYRNGRMPIRVMSKKALSLFTRWRSGTPYTSGAGLQDAGSEDTLGARDIVSAVSRAGGSNGGRPFGQPLRWGK